MSSFTSPPACWGGKNRSHRRRCTDRPPIRFLFLLACLLNLVGCTVRASFLSHTREYSNFSSVEILCPDSPGELARLGDVYVAQYYREPHPQFRLHSKRQSDGEDAESENATKPVKLPVAIETLEGKLVNLYKYAITLSSDNIQRGISNFGDTRRLERVLLKLVTGKAIKVAAVGGSVTAGSGPENQKLVWINQVFDWINLTFPNSEHQLINSAVGAVTSGHLAPCLPDLVPADADLVFVEFTLNDGFEIGATKSEEYPHHVTIGLERMLRKLLLRESRPAVLNLHYHPFNTYAFPAGGENDLEMFHKYYAVPSLSMRSALLTPIEDQPWLKGVLWNGYDHHPSCVGSRYVADIVIGFLQDFSALLLHMYHLPHVQQHLPHAEVLQEQLPTPIFKNNTADHRQLEKCIAHDEFYDLAYNISEWEWVDEGHRAGQHKWGYVSHKPGGFIVFSLPIEAALPLLDDRRQLLIGLGVLISYEHNGWLRATCVNGCSCERTMDTFHHWRWSKSYWKKLDVQLDDDSTTCDVSIQNIDKTSTREHKVKVDSLLVSTAINSFVDITST